MKPNRLLQKFLTVTAVLAANASAAVVASYNFTTDYASSDSGLLSTSSALTFGAGAIDSLSTVNQTNGQFLAVSNNVDTFTLADAIANGVSFSFTITPDPGASISFDSIAGLVRRSATTSTRGFAIRSDKTGTTDLAFDADIGASRPGGFENFTPSAGSLTLSGVAALQNVTTPTTFTVFANPNGTVAQNRLLDFDNIVLNATIIPEPSVSLLAALGALALLRRRR